MVMPMPGTMLMKNSQCHDIMLGDETADRRPDGRRQRRDQADDRDRRCGISSAETPCRRDANTVGIMPAPRNPWIARHRIICSMVEAKPQKRLATVKPEAEIANSRRVPNARDRNPKAGSRSPRRSGRRSAPTTLRWSWPKGRPGSPDSDAETTWMSRIDMNIPNTMMRKANSRRGGIRSRRGVHHGRRCGGGVGHDQLGTGAGLRRGAREKLLRLNSSRAHRGRPRSASAAPSRVSTVV